MADTVPDAAPSPSLQRKFTRAVILAAVLPAVGLGLADQVAAYRSQTQYLRDRVEVTAALSGAAVDEFVQAKLSSVALLADLGTVVKADGWRARLGELRERYPHFISALVTDGNGTVLAMSPEPPANAPSSGVRDREYFRVPQGSHRPYVSDAFVGRRLGNDALVAVSAPLMTDGRFMGVVEGSIPVSAFVSVRTSAIQRRGMELLIVDRSHRVIHASDGIPYAFLPDAGDRVAFEDPVSGRRSTPAVFMSDVMRDGRGAWMSQARLESGWTLIVFAPETELWSFLYRRALTSFGIMTLVLLGVWFAYRWQMRRFNAALKRLVESLGGLAGDGGNTISRIASLPDEFQPLGRAIRDLSQRLESTNTDLQASLQEQRNLALSLQDSLQQTESEVAARTAELQAAVEALDRLNQTDALTGCLNRRGLQKRLSSWSDDRGELFEPITAIAFDVDHFKAYNDRYGHAAGDTALSRLAGAVSGLLDDSPGCLARSGGDVSKQCAASATECSYDLSTYGLGLHRLEVEPPTNGAGTVSFLATLSNEAQDSLQENVPELMNISRPGQSARYEFAVVAGVSLTMVISDIQTSPSGRTLKYTVRNPNGSIYRGPINATSSTVINFPNPAASGTYLLDVDSPSGTTSQFRVEQNTGGTLTVGGAAVSYTSSVAWERSYLSFTVASTGNRRLRTNQLATPGTTNPARIEVHRPDGTTLTFQNCTTGTATCTFTLNSLAPGKYGVVVHPPAGGNGTMSFNQTLGTQ